MKIQYKEGFTLIELLVVVLLIGILTAIALPQYQKAVEKSKATQALVILRHAAQLAEAYYLTNGQWPGTFEEMGLEVPWTGKKRWTESAVLDSISSGEWSLQLGGQRTSPWQVFVGRIGGEYEGAGFVFFPRNSSVFNIEGIFCVERKSHGIVYSKKAGSYCQKIMNMPNDVTANFSGYSSYRVYTE